MSALRDLLCERVPEQRREAPLAVLSVLEAADGHPMPNWELAEKTGLSVSKLRRTTLMLRELVYEVDGVWWVWGPQGVALTRDEMNWQSFQLQQKVVIVKQLRRVLTGMIEPMLGRDDLPDEDRRLFEEQRDQIVALLEEVSGS